MRQRLTTLRVQAPRLEYFRHRKGLDMEAERTYVAKNGDKVEECYWNGRYITYINNMKSDKCFNEVVDEYEVSK